MAFGRLAEMFVEISARLRTGDMEKIHAAIAGADKAVAGTRRNVSGLAEQSKAAAEQFKSPDYLGAASTAGRHLEEFAKAKAKILSEDRGKAKEDILRLVGAPEGYGRGGETQSGLSATGMLLGGPSELAKLITERFDGLDRSLAAMGAKLDQIARSGVVQPRQSLGQVAANVTPPVPVPLAGGMAGATIAGMVGGAGSAAKKYADGGTIEPGSFVIRKAATEALGPDVVGSLGAAMVPGEGNTDSVPVNVAGGGQAKVMPGEAIVPPEVAATLGKAKMEELNQADRHVDARGPVPYAAGGTVRSVARAMGYAKGEYVQPQTESEAFKKWFGDSKVVDEEGKPLRVFHGTQSKYEGKPFSFDSFDTMGGSDLGSHFGSIEQAHEFVREGRSGVLRNQQIIPAYLSIKNPLRLPDLGRWDFDKVADYLKSHAGIEVAKPAYEYHSADMAANFIHNQRRGREAIASAMEKAGYDGIVYMNTSEGVDHAALNKEREKRKVSFDHEPEIPDDVLRSVGAKDSYIALRPEQIKSATGNRGTFDPTDPRIAYAAGGQIASALAAIQKAAGIIVGRNRIPFGAESVASRLLAKHRYGQKQREANAAKGYADGGEIQHFDVGGLAKTGLIDPRTKKPMTRTTIGALGEHLFKTVFADKFGEHIGEEPSGHLSEGAKRTAPLDFGYTETGVELKTVGATSTKLRPSIKPDAKRRKVREARSLGLNRLATVLQILDHERGELSAYAHVGKKGRLGTGLAEKGPGSMRPLGSVNVAEHIQQWFADNPTYGIADKKEHGGPVRGYAGGGSVTSLADAMQDAGEYGGPRPDFGPQRKVGDVSRSRRLRNDPRARFYAELRNQRFSRRFAGMPENPAAAALDKMRAARGYSDGGRIRGAASWLGRKIVGAGRAVKDAVMDPIGTAKRWGPAAIAGQTLSWGAIPAVAALTGGSWWGGIPGLGPLATAAIKKLTERSDDGLPDTSDLSSPVAELPMAMFSEDLAAMPHRFADGGEVKGYEDGGPFGGEASFDARMLSMREKVRKNPGQSKMYNNIVKLMARKVMRTSDDERQAIFEQNPVFARVYQAWWKKLSERQRKKYEAEKKSSQATIAKLPEATPVDSPRPFMASEHLGGAMAGTAASVSPTTPIPSAIPEGQAPASDFGEDIFRKTAGAVTALGGGRGTQLAGTGKATQLDPDEQAARQMLKNDGPPSMGGYTPPTPPEPSEAEPTPQIKARSKKELSLPDYMKQVRRMGGATDKGRMAAIKQSNRDDLKAGHMANIDAAMQAHYQESDEGQAVQQERQKQGLDYKHHDLRAQVAAQSASVAHLESMPGQAQQQRIALATGALANLGQRDQVAGQRAELSAMRSPEGRKQGVEKEQLGAASALLAVQKQQAEGEAKLAFLRSSAGQQYIRDNAAVSRQLAQQEKELEKLINPMGVFKKNLAETVNNAGMLGGIGMAGITAFVRAASPAVFDTFSGSIQYLMATIGEAFTPVLIKISKKIQDLGEWIEKLDGKTKTSIGTWIGWGAAGLSVIGILGKVIGLTGLLGSTLGGLGSVVTGSMGLVGRAVGGAASAVGRAATAPARAVGRVLGGRADRDARRASRRPRNRVGRALGAVGGAARGAGKLAVGGGMLLGGLGLAGAAVGAVMNATGRGGEEGAGGGMLAPIMEAIAPAMQTLSETLTPAITQLMETLAPVLGELASTLAPVLGEVVATIAPALGEIVSSLAPVIGELVSTLAPVFGELVSTLAPVIGEMVSILAPILSQVVSTLAPVISTMVSVLSPILKNIIAPALSVLAKVLNYAVDGFYGAVNFFINGINLLIDCLNKLPGVAISQIANIVRTNEPTEDNINWGERSREDRRRARDMEREMVTRQANSLPGEISADPRQDAALRQAARNRLVQIAREDREYHNSVSSFRGGGMARNNRTNEPGLRHNIQFQSNFHGIEAQWKRLQQIGASLNPHQQRMMEINQRQLDALLQVVNNTQPVAPEP